MQYFILPLWLEVEWRVNMLPTLEHIKGTLFSMFNDSLPRHCIWVASYVDRGLSSWTLQNFHNPHVNLSLTLNPFHPSRTWILEISISSRFWIKVFLEQHSTNQFHHGFSFRWYLKAKEHFVAPCLQVNLLSAAVTFASASSSRFPAGIYQLLRSLLHSVFILPLWLVPVLFPPPLPAFSVSCSLPPPPSAHFHSFLLHFCFPNSALFSSQLSVSLFFFFKSIHLLLPPVSHPLLGLLPFLLPSSLSLSASVLITAFN